MNFDFAGEGIDLRHAGNGPEVKALCPRCSAGRKKRTQKCLNVNLDTGVWHCWHCEWAGKALDVDAERARRVEQRVMADRPKAYAKPKLVPQGLTEAALQWFAKRGITPEVLERNRVTVATVFMPQIEREVSAIAFPFFRDGEHVDTKYRDREKNFRRETGAERVLYGLDDLAETTLIVEGEMDKLSCEVAGFPNCVSVPDGAPAANVKNIENKFDFLNDDRLERVQRWVIAVDNDGPGKRLQDELVRRLGAEKCLIVSWPDGEKDANDVLVNHGPRTLKECIEAATPVPIEGVFDALAFGDDFLARYDQDQTAQGFSTGWEDIDEFWRAALGQLTIVSGVPGHGKSEFVDALCVNFVLDHGWPVGMFSPENHPVALHMEKLAEKYVGKPYRPGPTERMTRAEAAAALDWLQEHFHWIYPERPTLTELMGLAQSLVRRFGLRVLVLTRGMRSSTRVRPGRPRPSTSAPAWGSSGVSLERTRCWSSSWRTRGFSRRSPTAPTRFPRPTTSLAARTGGTRPTTASRSSPTPRRKMALSRSTSRRSSSRPSGRSAWCRCAGTGRQAGTSRGRWLAATERS